MEDGSCKGKMKYFNLFPPHCTTTLVEEGWNEGLCSDIRDKADLQLGQ
jgi:hypothetical protein